MSDDDATEFCVIDTGGLVDVAHASGNVKSTALSLLTSGAIHVPSWVWKELKEAYPEEAEELSSYVNKRIAIKQSITVRAAQIAEKLNSGFSKGPYDNHVCLLTAAAAINSGFCVVSSDSDLNTYSDMDCDAFDLETWINERD